MAAIDRVRERWDMFATAALIALVGKSGQGPKADALEAAKVADAMVEQFRSRYEQWEKEYNDRPTQP
jgi:hypothetical protein